MPNGVKISRFTLTGIALLSLTGALAIIFSTHWGPWAYSDASVYIVSARNLLQDGYLGFYAPSGSLELLVHHPPFYPLCLSALGLLGIELLMAARWLNVVLFGATIFMVGAFTYRLLRSPLLAIILSAATLVMPTMIDAFSGAMSEPLFMFTAVLATLLILLFLETDRRHTLFLAAVAAGLAFFTRYIGISVIVSCLVILLLLMQATWKKRITNLAIFSGVSLLPNAVWWAYVYLHTTTLGARQLVSEADIWNRSVELRLQLMELFWGWLPFAQDSAYTYARGRNVLLAIGLLILIVLSLAGWDRWRVRQATWQQRAGFRYVLAWGLFSLCYLAFFAQAYLFTSPPPDPLPRTVLPLEFSLLVVLLSAIYLLSRLLKLPSWSSLIPLFMLLTYGIAKAPASIDLISNYYQYGGGYTSPAWRTSTTLAYLQTLPEDTPVITNQAAAVLLWTGRAPYDFCELSCDQPAGVSYGDNPSDETQSIFRAEKAALVLFYPFCDLPNQPWNQRLVDELNHLTQGLEQVSYSCDGAVYFYP